MSWDGWRLQEAMADRMELLAPAGDMDALRAAVQNGADAVYLGAGRFNARRKAGNFDGDNLKAAVDYCHARGVKVHVTLNTLVRQDELDALYDTIRAVNQSGADAAIVQDFGAARAIREIAPEMELHASTQMAAHNAHAARFLKARGFDRVVLAREATFEDMAACVAEDIDVEVFVHGALCVACSGQCLMSSMVGGRSGNRGLCAQPCRLPWRLDGHEGYLLSTRDLCALDDLPRLRDIGVKSLKIEGRLKRAEYVAVTVAAYRRALDALADQAPVDLEAEKDALRQMFNRGGFTRGYGPGMKEAELMYPDRPNHAGVQAGLCRRAGEIALEKTVEAADTLALNGDIPVKLSGEAGETVKCPQARKGDRLIRLVSEAQMRQARESFEAEHRQTGVSMSAVFKVGQPARLRVSDVEVAGDVVQRATGKPFDPDRAERQLCRTGGTAYQVEAVSIDADPDAFVPVSELNALRRKALDALDARRTAIPRASRFPTLPKISRENTDRPLLYAQSGDPDALQTALQCGADVAVYCPEDLRRPGTLPEGYALAVPAVLTDAALKGLNEWALDHRDGIAATFLSNIGHLGLDWPGERIGDYLLNVGNDGTVSQLEAWGMDAYTPSVELTARQIAALHGRTNLIMWGRVPLMHLRHCPLRAAEGMKGRHADCAHCDTCAMRQRLNGKQLIDRKNAAFPLRRIAMPGGCVIQVLNSVPLMPLKRLEKMPKTSGWRLLLDQGDPVEAVVKVYRAALDGRDFKALPEWALLEDMNATTGHYFRGVE